MIISIDFDGTCVSHEFPKVGKDIGSIPVLMKMIKAGHQIILFTMRSKDNYLDDAIKWFDDNNIPLYGINKNPTQFRWTKSPKAYANLYIDDAALGCPLKYNEKISERPFVDWIEVEKILIEQGVL